MDYNIQSLTSKLKKHEKIKIKKECVIIILSKGNS
jgi:hypothetical protein